MRPTGKQIRSGLLCICIIFLTGCERGGDNSSGNVTLTVDKFGAGAITTNGSGIHCGSDCSESYPLGTTVVLTATDNNSGSSFSYWTGCDSASANTCTVRMDASRIVFPTFALINTVIPETTKVLDDTAMKSL